MGNFKFFVVILTALLEKFLLASGQGACPQVEGAFKRIGDTRFFIQHHPQRGDYVNWTNAKVLCNKIGMKMAKIDKITTLAQVGRPLERMVNEFKLKDTWYWLDAVYDNETEKYFWLEDGKRTTSLAFSNFVYRQARPTGVGAHVNFRHKYKIDATFKQCLTLALPWPGLFDKHTYPNHYGHQTSIDERPCESVQTRHAMCESKNPNCHRLVTEHFELSEDPIKQKYFDEGNWIFGDRKYIVNWAQKNQTESKKYCETLGLKLYNPTLRDTCLIPLLKMWTRNITVSQFWTDWTYTSNGAVFQNATGQEVARNTIPRDNFSESDNVFRSNKNSPLFCVTMVHLYEYRFQQPCSDPRGIDCVWNYIHYAPANCNNPQGVVCQHDNYNLLGCSWMKTWINNITQGVEETATLPFGWRANKNAHRSKYKQTFGSLLCPPATRMARQNTTLFKEKPVINGTTTTVMHQKIKYDYMESYWVVDNDGFKKGIESNCTLSVPKGGTTVTDGERELVKVKCKEWHFYICEAHSAHFREWKGAQPNIPKMGWNFAATPREYPIVP